MIAVVVVLTVLLALAVVALVATRHQIRSVTDQLERRAEGRMRGAVAISDIDGVLGDLVSTTNLTIRDAEKAIARSHRDEQRFRELIADISHDLRTPLAVVSGYLQALSSTSLDQAQCRAVDVSRRHVAEVASLVDRFFEYAYLLEDPEANEASGIDLTALVSEALLASTDQLEAQGMDVSLEAPPTLAMNTDQGKVLRIVQNLVRNAAVHGRGTLRVTLQVTPGASGGESGREAAVASLARIRFSNRVEDPDRIDVEHLLDRYYFGRDRAVRDSGTAGSAGSVGSSGLGLAIVAILVQQLGGRAQADMSGDELTIQVDVPVSAEAMTS